MTKLTAGRIIWLDRDELSVRQERQRGREKVMVKVSRVK